jgi:hypothetical protein
MWRGEPLGKGNATGVILTLSAAKRKDLLRDAFGALL